MNTFSGTRRGFLVLTLVAALIAASCGGDGDRSRNVETIAATACTKKGATRKVSKVNYVCGTATTGKVWFAVVGKLTTKGAKSCKPVGKYDATKSRVCATVKKSNVWVKVAPLPVAMPGVGATTLPSDTTLPTPSDGDNTSGNGSTNSDYSGKASEVAAALEPEQQPNTVEKFVELLKPRPVEAQTTPLVPSAIKVSGGATTLENGGVPATPFSVAILDQDGKSLASSDLTVVVTPSRTDLELTNAVATTNEEGIATFDKLRIDGIAGPAELEFATNFGAKASVAITLEPGTGIRLGLGNAVTVVVVGEPFAAPPRVGVYDKNDNLVPATGTKIAATYDGKLLQEANVDSTGYAEFDEIEINTTLTSTAGKKATIEYSVVGEAGIRTIGQEVTLVAGAAAQLSVVTQPSANARAGLMLETQPALRFIDKNGNPIGTAGAKISVEVVCPPNVTCGLDGKRAVETDDSGIARFTDLAVHGKIGEYQLLFFSEDTALINLSAVITLSAGSPASIVATKTTSVFKHDVKVANAFELQTIDAWDNPVSDFDGALEVATRKSVDFVVAKGTRFVDGVAKFDATLRGAAGAVGFRFLSGGQSSQDYEASVVAGDPATIEVLTTPGSVTAGREFSPKLAARFRDSADNVVAVAGNPILLTMSGATSYEEIALTNSSGIAVFSITKLTKAGTTTLKYSDSVGNAAPQNDAITVVAGTPATARLISQAVIYERSGVSFAIQPVVQLVDAEGNDAASSNVVVTATIGFGCGSARLSNNSATSDANGRVTFINLALAGTECGYEIGFRPKDGFSTARLSVSLGYGLPARIEILTQPAGARNRIPLTTQPVIVLKDSAGNTSKTGGVAVTTTLDGQSAVAFTDVGGRAVFSGLTASGRIGIRSVTFLSDGLTSVVSQYFVMSAGVATQLVPSEASISVSQGGDLPYLKVKDADGNDTDLAEPVIVEASSPGATAWVSGMRVRSALSGVVGFLGARVWSTSNRATLRFVVSGRTISASVPVSFTRSLRPGDTGPTGGVIIGELSSSEPPFISRAEGAAGLSTGGRFIEAAPPGWNGNMTDPALQWGTRTRPASTNALYASNMGSLGSAATNSRRYLDYLMTLSTTTIVSKTLIETVADTFAFDTDDWLLPTVAEVRAMLEYAQYDNSKLQLTFANGDATYWSSSYDYSTNAAIRGVNSQSTAVYQYDVSNMKSQTTALSVRPIRYVQ